MDEIICSQCGKANLLSDIKCRYCQAPLEKSGTEPPQEAEVPEWLKRIRELKTLDEEREKEKEKWRQQTLFGQNNDQQKQKNKAPEKKSETLKRIENPTQEQIKSSGKPQQTTAPEVKSLFQPDKDEENKAAPGNEDLPEGFSPLSIDEDNH
jgi:hypothetical protein